MCFHQTSVHKMCIRDREVQKVKDNLETQRLSTLLTGEYDSKNAILTFHAGSGGTRCV